MLLNFFVQVRNLLYNLWVELSMAKNVLYGVDNDLSASLHRQIGYRSFVLLPSISEFLGTLFAWLSLNLFES